MASVTVPRRLWPVKVSLLAAVAVGGALGGVARYLLGEAFPTSNDGFPWTTLAINVTGSFILALLPAFAVVRRHEVLPPLLGTGVLGGYTTLSTYSEQARHLLDIGRSGLALTYLVGTLAACLVGVAVADRFSTRAERVEFEVEEGDL
jgi:fluoride exporter